MPGINLGSELLETTLTPQEVNVAMQLMNKDLSVAYLQNSRVNIFRQLATQEFTDPEKDGENHRVRAYLKGQLDILETLIQGALEPTPVPLEQPSQQPSPGAK
jgi:putative sterol carrier protein